MKVIASDRKLSLNDGLSPRSRRVNVSGILASNSASDGSTNELLTERSWYCLRCRGSLSAVASESGDYTSFIAGEGGSIRGCSISRSLRVAKRGGQSSCWLSAWARIKASVHNWKKWLRSLNPNSRTTRSSRSRFSSRTLVVRFGFCCNLAVEEFSMAKMLSHAALRSEKIGPPFEQLCDATGYYREGQSEYLCYKL
jgi:hypothetical protein